MEKVQVKVIIEKSSYGFSAYMDSGSEVLDYGCIGEGKTVEETVADFKDSYEEIKEYILAKGEAFTEAEFEFFYDVASFIQHYAYAFSLAGLERITGINQKQVGHYVSGYRRPSPKTVKKIEEGVRRFSKELSAVHFI